MKFYIEFPDGSVSSFYESFGDIIEMLQDHWKCKCEIHNTDFGKIGTFDPINGFVPFEATVQFPWTCKECNILSITEVNYEDIEKPDLFDWNIPFRIKLLIANDLCPICGNRVTMSNPIFDLAYKFLPTLN